MIKFHIVNPLHSVIDYSKLITLQAKTLQEPVVEEVKQKTYTKNASGNQRWNRNRETNGINPKIH